MTELIRLFFAFARIGLFTFGGGYAMLPMLRREVVNKHKWLDDEELLNVFAIGQSTPGIIAINVATFVGTRQKGFAGAVFATLGMVLPSLIIITAIAAGFTEIKDNLYAQKAFAGIRCAVAGLLVIIVSNLIKKATNDYFGYALIALSFCSVVFLKIPAIAVIISGGVLGLIYYTLVRKIKIDTLGNTSEDEK